MRKLKGYNFEFNKFLNPKIFDNQDNEDAFVPPPIIEDGYLFEDGNQFLFEDGVTYEFNT
jgi:hypothetical protein